MSEDIVADREGASWSLDLVNAPLQILQQANQKPLWVYTKVVEPYTRRNLTKKWDILAAFSGIYRMLERKMKTKFVFGLPASHFDLAILWQSEKVVNRRIIQKEDARNLSDSENEFPSWSWCGWESSPILYDTSTLDSIFRDTNAWLSDHAWITWYVRDGYGDLRPLWDRSKCRRNPATEYRWQGYEAPYEFQSHDRLAPAGAIIREKGFDQAPNQGIEFRDVQQERSSSVRPDESVSVNHLHRNYAELRVTLNHNRMPENDGEVTSYMKEESQDDNGDTYWRIPTPINPQVSNFSNRDFRRTLREFSYRVVQKPY
jgi:hypothetical protein